MQEFFLFREGAREREFLLLKERGGGREGVPNESSHLTFVIEMFQAVLCSSGDQVTLKGMTHTVLVARWGHQLPWKRTDFSKQRSRCIAYKGSSDKNGCWFEKLGPPP